MGRTTGLVADRVRLLRTRHGWSARQLAEECARAGLDTLTRSTIAKIESGVRKSVTAEEVEVLARVFGITPTELLAAEEGDEASVTVLHLSDLLLGSGDDAVLGLPGDVEQLAEDHGVWPELLVVTGGLTATARVGEFAEAEQVLGGLAERLGLDRSRVVVVPGASDVSRKKCMAYFAACEADEVEPTPPYFPKWEHYQRLLRDLCADVPGAGFEAGRPWTLFEIAELQVVVAGYNSTIAISHRDEDQYGSVGQEQAAWFAERLADYRDRGWLRIGAVHHSPLPDAERGLRDAEALGDEVNLLLHGDGAGLGELASGLPVAGAGSGRRYQLLRLTPAGLTLWGRHFDPGGPGWTADEVERLARPWPSAGTTLPRPDSRPVPDSGQEGQPVAAEPARREDAVSVLLRRLAAVARKRHPGAAVETVEHDPPYLLVTYDDGGFTRQLRLGGCVGDPTRQDLDAFLAEADSFRIGADSELVYQGGRPDDALLTHARGRGVRLRSLLEFQGLLDLRGYLARQAERLAGDPEQAPAAFRVVGDEPGEVRADLPGAALRWLRSADAQFVMVLGDPDQGTTALLRDLARRLPAEVPDLVPILLQARDLARAGTLDELVRRHLAAHDEDEGFSPEKFAYLLRSGRVVLLLDGFDELTRPERGRGGARFHGVDTAGLAADHLQTLLDAAEGSAKLVVTSRALPEFAGRLREQIGQRPGRRLVRVEP